MNVVQNVVQDDYFVTIFIISSKTTIWHSNYRLQTFSWKTFQCDVIIITLTLFTKDRSRY